MKLYIFNPDADMALANNEENYMPPRSACQMAQDLALLPMWYAQPGSAVLASSAYNTDFLKRMQQLFSLPAHLITEPELPHYAEAQVVPWGWNLALRKRLLRGGVAAQILPTTECIAHYRTLSSREIAMEVLNLFHEEAEEWSCGCSYRLAQPDSCKEYVERNKTCVLKAPWSGSGKGLNWCQGVFTPSIEGWCLRILKEQGFVVGEPVYNKVEDFAMEFYSDGQGEVRFVGYSLFSTNKSGAYSGNLLMSAEEIEKRLTFYVSLAVIVRLREKLCRVLAQIYGSSYTGCLGVDMMVCRAEPELGYRIHPCVEINMRMNMGVVSCLLYERHLVAGSIGRFCIEYYPSPQELRRQHDEDSKNYPLVMLGSRLASGYLPLVPITAKSCYRAYVCVDSSTLF